MSHIQVLPSVKKFIISISNFSYQRGLDCYLDI
jgi:hypothetical protein